MLLTTHLKAHFGYDSFRPGQTEIIESILQEKDTLALMPTGGGKSICFQLPALLLPGLTIVISPLIALMKDQVDALQAKGIPSTYLNSTLSEAETKQRLQMIKTGEVRMIYVAPERVALPGFISFLQKLPVSMVAIDEAHCVSQWGHDFRPDYLQIDTLIRSFEKRPIVSAFTATATPEVKEDIIRRLALREPNVFVRGFDRPNLLFFVRKDMRESERFEEVARLIGSFSGSGVVYVGRRDDTTMLVEYLQEKGIKALPYHGGMESSKRSQVQEQFMQDEISVIVATIAFGMGVDKPDVRFVIHAHMPSSLEGYYQEAGRAGRDGEKAYCILLHTKKDDSLHQYFIRQSYYKMLENGSTEQAAKAQSDIKYARLDRMKHYVNTRHCRRKIILNYFDDRGSDERENCRTCDICMNYSWKDTSGSGLSLSGLRHGVDRLWQKLKRRLQRLSRKSGLKPYMIASDATLREISEKKPATRQDLLQVSGMNENIVNRFGKDFLDVVRRFDSVSSTRETLDLFQQGLSVEQIAEARFLKPSTIISHLFDEFYEGEELDLSRIVPSEVEKEIRTVLKTFTKLPVGTTEIKERCSPQVDYSHIRFILEKIRREKKE